MKLYVYFPDYFAISNGAVNKEEFTQIAYANELHLI